MPFVVDASVTLCWLMPDERDPVAEAAARRLAQDIVIVPSLWWFEVRNGLVVGERRGRLDSRQTSEVLQVLAKLPIAIDAESDGEALMRLARVHRLTIYDAAYLELAIRKGSALATVDNALAKAARAAGVELI